MATNEKGQTSLNDLTNADSEALLKRLVEKGIVSVDAINAEIDEIRAGAADKAGAELRKSEKVIDTVAFLSGFKARFDALEQLHDGVHWVDVEKSLLADPEAMAKLHALDEKGYQMNVFGEENGEYIFASAWSRYQQVAEDHRNIVFDKGAQEYLKRNHLEAGSNGNATDIVKTLGVDLADPQLHEQLRKVVEVNGWTWLKGEVVRKTPFNNEGGQVAINANRLNIDGEVCGSVFFGRAVYGNSARIGGIDSDNHNNGGSFRATLRVKKV